jgi:hypothetical protein
VIDSIGIVLTPEHFFVVPEKSQFRQVQTFEVADDPVFEEYGGPENILG